MTSRLDRLFVLLDTGGSGITRHAAARQLGEVVKLHPHDLHSLLDRLHPYIISKSWDTRIAAGQAVEAIIENLPKWDPTPIDEHLDDSKVLNDHLGQLSLKSFSIKQVLQHGSYLLAADEKQFEVDESSAKMDPKERAMKQRLIVNQSLGLDLAEAMGIDTRGIVSNCDLMEAPSQNTSAPSKQSIAHIVENEMASSGMLLSCRELNRAKRKAKSYGKQKSIENSVEDGPERKKFRSSSQDEEMEAKPCIEYEDNFMSQNDEWPLEEFCDKLCLDLFSNTWETRHGAATALREVVKLHGNGGGKATKQDKYQMCLNHERWLEDKAVRLVCVLALDRFGDFVADQVVAPVRETSAQVLGSLLTYMPVKIIFEVLSLLQEMLLWNEWGTRHGGLLGLKYLLAVRADLRSDLLKQIYTNIYKGLKDDMDDVVAVAATCLASVADDIVKCLSLGILQDLVATLWESLLDIDDLTVSTSSILLLISKLINDPDILKNITPNLDTFVPRLWPFLYHSSREVRRSSLKALHTLMQHYLVTKDGPHETTDLNGGGGGCTNSNYWLESVLEPLLVHIFQRALLEENAENRVYILKTWQILLANVSLSKLLVVICRLVPSWLCLLMSSPKIPLDATLLLIPRHTKSVDSLKKNETRNNLGEIHQDNEVKFYFGGTRTDFSDKEVLQQVTSARCTVAKLLGNLSHYVSQPMPGVTYSLEETPILCYVRLFVSHLKSRSALQRLGIGLVVREWAIQHPETQCHPVLAESLITSLTDVVYYDELAWSFTRLQQETKDFIALMKHYSIHVDESFSTDILTLEMIQELTEKISAEIISSSKVRKKVFETLDSRRKSILHNVMQASGDHLRLAATIQSILSGALVRFSTLPEKLNPVVKPLMENIKKEENEQFQSLAAADLAILLELCLNRQPCPNAKILRNLAFFVCIDDDFTPNVLENKDNLLKDGIWTVLKSQKTADLRLLRRSSSLGSRGPGRPSSKPITPDVVISEDVQESFTDFQAKKKKMIQRRGCTLALVSICEYFGDKLFQRFPSFIELIFDPIEKVSSREAASDLSAVELQELINWLQLLEIVIPHLHQDLLKRLECNLPVFDVWLYSSYVALRHMASRVIATLASISSCYVMSHLIENSLPVLNRLTEDHKRQGLVECLYVSIERLGFEVVPYIVLLIVPLLGRMSDPNPSVRTVSMECFAALIRLFPLESTILDPPGLNPQLSERKCHERYFIDQLIDPKKIEDYKLPVPINAELRPYQQRGINWLHFLNQYKLHGILCDDMGLGKTLQSLCILLGDHYKKEAELKDSKRDIGKEIHPCRTGVQSIVICPPTLTGHWHYEVEKFVPKKYLNSLHYAGPPNERKRLRGSFFDHNLIIASYKIVRNEIDFFGKIKWNYIILDEGHIIKNGKTKSSKAIKELTGNHRLILSGTPIQNNVLELWSLFDFLMPGYLGTERQFMAKFSRPILQSREAKSTPKEQEAGVLAMENLHRQTLPFLLRRVKEDVLKDLPPKITQDYYCELSPLQEKLYEDFARSHACQNLGEDLENGAEDEQNKTHGHIFQALQYLRRVCNHPKLVIQQKHPQYVQLMQEITASNTPLSDISYSAKLPALKQLLLDCGIGSEDTPDICATNIVSPHRALVFCQLKAMLDIIEEDLLKAHFPNVTYLRLDGSVPSNSRHSLVHRFNSDPSIDLLLLTTQVGGLGLNLTGADTVIFVEHDWNPMRDLQAMDRAHRIGQKKVVNVYRLITKGTLEEKIMSLQKFKVMTANSVISHENASLSSMATDQLLDLFDLQGRFSNPNSQGGPSSELPSGKQRTSLKEVIDSLPELWDESQYEREYNMEAFLQTLK